MFNKALLAVLLTSTLGSVALRAQSNLGSIVGTAMDASQAAMPNVSVSVTSVDTGQTRKFNTDSTGNYQVTRLQPGNYRVEADAAGFRHFVNENVYLFPGATIRVDARFEVASTAQQTTVTAVAEGTPEIEIESTGLNDLRDTRQYRTLPQNQSREPYTILASMPSLYTAQTQNSSSAYKYSIAGGRTGQYELPDGRCGRAEQFNLPTARLPEYGRNARGQTPGRQQLRRIRRTGDLSIHQQLGKQSVAWHGLLSLTITPRSTPAISSISRRRI